MAKRRAAGRASGNGAAGRPPRRALTANMEDYIEAIYRLSDASGTCRVSGIAETLGVKRPSVSKALKRLRGQGLVTHHPYGGVGMTERGRALAREQVRAHRVLTRFLTGVLKLPPALAEHDACLIEHAISHATVERLVEFIDHLALKGRRAAFRSRARAAPVRELARAAARSWRSRV